MPDRKITFPSKAVSIVSPRTGIVRDVRRVQHGPDFPATLITFNADVADMRRVRDWHNDPLASGTSWSDPAAARAAALGEAIERYCGNWIDSAREVRFGSWEQLVREGLRALDPERIVLFSDKQYQAKGFPFAPLTRRSPLHWVLGHSITRDEPIWVPGCLVYVRWPETNRNGEPRHVYPVLAGIAAGASFEDAVVSGLEEVIERDATMVWWHNAHPLPQVAVPDEILNVWADSTGVLKPSLIYIENEFELPVLAGVVHDTERGYFNIGFACRTEGHAAALKALAEGLILHETSRSLDTPGRLENAANKGTIAVHNLKPWRRDRRYLDAYRRDFHDVLDLMCQGQVYLDPRAVERVAPWTQSLPQRSFAEVPRAGERTLQNYRQRVEARGYEIVAVDVTSPDAALAGYSAVRVIVPGLVTNFPAAFPHWGKRRIQDAAVRLGWRRQPLAEEELNPFPLPHI